MVLSAGGLDADGLDAYKVCDVLGWMSLTMVMMVNKILLRSQSIAATSCECPESERFGDPEFAAEEVRAGAAVVNGAAVSEAVLSSDGKITCPKCKYSYFKIEIDKFVVSMPRGPRVRAERSRCGISSQPELLRPAVQDRKWLSVDGKSCMQLAASDCSDEKVRGQSSNEACCQCGGGIVTPTPFSYSNSRWSLDSNIVMMPEPRTAERYTVDAKCELAAHNLTMDSSTGELQE
ncbi:unnamed protein product, partial [Symbiodinium microadriaticum]